jgi:hypothetical protein
VKIVQEDEKTLLIDHSELNHDPVNNTQYLMDETLFFRVTVEAADYKPWLECTGDELKVTVY